jgi:hypothetical protein
MDLRFLKGDWEFGKLKLQVRRTKKGKWVDVPSVDLTPKTKSPTVKPSEPAASDAGKSTVETAVS